MVLEEEKGSAFGLVLFDEHYPCMAPRDVKGLTSPEDAVQLIWIQKGHPVCTHCEECQINCHTQGVQSLDLKKKTGLNNQGTSAATPSVCTSVKVKKSQAQQSSRASASASKQSKPQTGASRRRGFKQCLDLYFM